MNVAWTKFSLLWGSPGEVTTALQTKEDDVKSSFSREYSLDWTVRSETGYIASVNAGSTWTFLTNHALVLLTVAREPGLTLRQIGDRVGITERATHSIISDLAAEALERVLTDGRRHLYRVNKARILRHPETSHVQVRDLLDVLRPPS